MTAWVATGQPREMSTPALPPAVPASVVVLGSANADLVLTVDRLPGPGETVLAAHRRSAAGGKGANQAAAAARTGTPTALLAAVGSDDSADLLRDALAGAGVDLSRVRTVAGSSGLAVVMVGADGQNSIVVAPGANEAMQSLDEAERHAISAAQVLLCQLEVPVSVVLEAAHCAHRAGVRVVVNAAPTVAVPAELWPLVDVLIVNEHEAADLAGPGAAEDPALLLPFAPTVVVTLGSKGVRTAARDGSPLQVAAPVVAVLDTTGAGDTFCGVLAAGLAAGREWLPLLQLACAAGALAVQRSGGIASVPDAAEVQRLWAATYQLA